MRTERIPIAVLAAALLVAGLAGCDWAAVDGPWNRTDPPDPDPGTLDLAGVVLTPDGSRPVAGATVELVDDEGVVTGLAVTGADGGWQVEAAPGGRHTLAGGIGHFELAAVVDLVADDDLVELEPLRLSSTIPIVLDVRGGPGDPVDERLEALGAASVREGPNTAAGAADLFALPQGLFEYDLVLIGGGLDYPALIDDEQAVGALADWLEGGGGLYLSGEAFPLLLALAPGSFLPHPEQAAFGYVEARVARQELSDQLQWETVGVPIPAGTPVLDVAGPDSVVWLTGEVETASGALVDGPLVLDLPFGAGRIVYVSFAAAEPRSDEWWQGSPSAWSLPDGSWDGRGTIVDRMLLRL